MKLVTEILGGPQTETVKEEPVKLVTEIPMEQSDGGSRQGLGASRRRSVAGRSADRDSNRKLT